MVSASRIVAGLQGGARVRPAAAAGVGLAVMVVMLLGFVASPAALLVLDNALVLAVFAVATNLLIGYGGLISFGQATFYGIGAYTVALGWQHLKTPYLLTLLLSPVVGACFAAVVGVFCLRVRRLYFALITLGFSQLFATITQKWSGLTLGDNGIFGEIIPSWLARPVTGHLFLAGISLLSIASLWKVVHSPFGMSLRAVRENRERAEALGVNTALVQWQAFVISGTFCSVAGALVVITQQGAYPQLFDWVQSGVPVIAAVVGGMMVFGGPVLGALVYQYGHDWTVQYTEHWQIVLGFILLAIVLVAPDGLVGLFGRAAKGLGRLGALRGGRRRVGGSSG